MPPYERYPFISQNQDSLYTPHSYIPATGQYYQQYAQPASFEAYDEADVYDMRADPVLSNNPATVNISLFKELTGYPNYGNPSRNADILYTGNQGVWTFDSPFLQLVPTTQRARLIIRAVLDDHTSVPVNRYSARITINGSVVHSGPLNLQHGYPAGGMFTNWRELTFNIPGLRRSNRITIVNTSRTGENDWIAFDWMEMRISRR